MSKLDKFTEVMLEALIDRAERYHQIAEILTRSIEVAWPEAGKEARRQLTEAETALKDVPIKREAYHE